MLFYDNDNGIICALLVIRFQTGVSKDHMESIIRFALLVSYIVPSILASGNEYENIPKSMGKKRNLDELLEGTRSEVEEIMDQVPRNIFEVNERLFNPLTIEASAASSSIFQGRRATPHPLFDLEKPSFQRDDSFSSKMNKTMTVQSSVQSSVKPPLSSNETDEKLKKWREQFFAAVQANDLSRLEFLATENSDAHFRLYSPINPKQFTYPLHYALQLGLSEVADFIINEMECEVDALDSFDHTALSITIERCDFKHFTVLLDKSKNLDVSVRGGLKLTHFAASMDTLSPMFLQSLAKKGMNFTDLCGKQGWTPLKYAVIADNPVLTRWINDTTPCKLSHPSNSSLLLDAAKFGTEEMVISLLSLDGFDLTFQDEEGRNIFHLLAKKGFIKALRSVPWRNKQILELINASDSKGFRPVHLAAKYNRTEIVLYLVNFSNLNAKTSDGFSVIEIAIESGAAETVRAMFLHNVFDYSESFNGEEFPAVLVLAYKTLEGHPRRIDVLKAILDAFQYDNLEREDEAYDRRYLFDEFGLNIIHYAVKENDLDLLKVLVEEYGMDVNQLDNQSYDIPANSPLAWAIYTKNLPIVKYLIDHGACISERLRLSCFMPETLREAEAEDEDEEDKMELDQLAEIFGGEEIAEIIKKRCK